MPPFRKDDPIHRGKIPARPSAPKSTRNSAESSRPSVEIENTPIDPERSRHGDSPIISELAQRLSDVQHLSPDSAFRTISPVPQDSYFSKTPSSTSIPQEIPLLSPDSALSISPKDTARPGFFEPIKGLKERLRRSSSEQDRNLNVTSNGVADEHPRPATPQSDALDFLQAVQFSDDSGSKSKSIRLDRLRNSSEAFKSIKGLFGELPSFWHKETSNLGDIVGNVKGDLLDFGMTTRQNLGHGNEGLCFACSKISFDQYRSDDSVAIGKSKEQPESEIIRPLEGILKNRKWCMFCRILFKALCQRCNDPLLTAPCIQDFIQEDLKSKTFEEWASEVNWVQLKVINKSVWPFGHSRDTKEADDAIQMNRIIVNAADAGILAGTIKNPHQAKVLATANLAVYNFALRNATAKRPLPCWVMVQMKNDAHEASGVLVVDVFSYGRAPRAPLSRISHFTLRVAAEHAPGKSKFGLRYGKRLDRHAIDLNLGKLWLSACEDFHGDECSSPAWTRQLQKPDADRFRLIDVVDQRLIEPQLPLAVDYICLSYVWGKYEAIKLDGRNLSQLTILGGLAPSRAAVSKTIRAAMDVTAALRQRYLWVDSLCIRQDDESEKATQIRQMDRIYGNALVTIVAADGTSADSGLKGVTYKRDIEQLAEEVRPGVVVLIPVEFNRPLYPWNARAWTLQEQLLSKRLLVFSGGHLSWHCKKGVAYEDMTEEDSGRRMTDIARLFLRDETQRLPSGFQLQQHPDGSFRLIRPRLFAEYTRLVEQYTHRHMTHSYDALNAIEGLLKILFSDQKARSKRESSSMHLHGLMVQYLDAALLWQPTGTENVRLRRRILPSSQRIPSWSWASWEPVEMQHDQTGKVFLYNGGVRYEHPFQVLTHSDGSLKKVLQDDGEERMRPMLRWHIFARSNPPPVPVKRSPSPRKSPARSAPSPTSSPPPKPLHLRTLSGLSPTTNPKQRLAPLNGSGLGIALELNGPPNNWTDTITKPTLTLDALSAEVSSSLSHQHLIFKTEVAKFSLGETHKRLEVIYKRQGSTIVEDHTLHISETDIIDESKRCVGRVVLPDPSQTPEPSKRYDFAVISEAQYFGDEERVDIMGFPLYNVMLIDWAPKRPFAERVALGKVFKRAWKDSNTQEEHIVLG
ncbi:MAG: hypothetical protein M1820_008398 [Bogoriella megaspora]|nr:MAG: hypothetical protein M1820_008398 [Bogoriella megaspora]